MISEENIDDYTKQLISELSDKISYLANNSYGNSTISKKAFEAKVFDTVRKAVRVFFFVKKHHLSGRDIKPYIILALKNFSKKEYRDLMAVKRVSMPFCPVCGSYLVSDGKLLRCQSCYEDVRSGNGSKLKSIFSLHSRSGYKCPDCNRFIPKSYTTQYSVSCPYNDCMWFGTIAELDIKSHPTKIGNSLPLLDLDATKQGYKESLVSRLDNKQPGAETKLLVTEQCEQDRKTLKDVIEAQMRLVNRQPRHKAIKKQLMYQAYYNMFEKSPDDMVMYLVHQKHPTDLPIQSRIFQEFIRLVQDELPFYVQKRGEQIEIYSLIDDGLDLLSGVTEYEASVEAGGIVPNKTKESYIGGREARDFGPCFIGHLCSVEDEFGNSLTVDHYTFSYVKVFAPIGTKVKVKHMYMPSHYEMNGLVPLQRIRRKIVDSVHQRVHGEKRIIKARKNAKDQELCKVFD